MTAILAGIFWGLDFSRVLQFEREKEREWISEWDWSRDGIDVVGLTKYGTMSIDDDGDGVQKKRRPVESKNLKWKNKILDERISVAVITISIRVDQSEAESSLQFCLNQNNTRSHSVSSRSLASNHTFEDDLKLIRNYRVFRSKREKVGDKFRNMIIWQSVTEVIYYLRASNMRQHW